MELSRCEEHEEGREKSVVQPEQDVEAAAAERSMVDDVSGSSSSSSSSESEDEASKEETILEAVPAEPATHVPVDVTPAAQPDVDAKIADEAQEAAEQDPKAIAEAAAAASAAAERLFQECLNNHRSLWHAEQVLRGVENRGAEPVAGIQQARQKLRAYWKRVTPENVKLITQKIAGTCSDWESAKKKFGWLRKSLTWDAGRAKVGKHSFSLEDFDEAGRVCFKRIHRDPKAKVKTAKKSVKVTEGAKMESSASDELWPGELASSSKATPEVVAGKTSLGSASASSTEIKDIKEEPPKSPAKPAKHATVVELKPESSPSPVAKKTGMEDERPLSQLMTPARAGNSEAVSKLSSKFEQSRAAPSEGIGAAGMRLGSRVLLGGHNAVKGSKPGHSGQLGTLIGYDKSSSRWRIRLDSGLTKMDFSANLRLVGGSGRPCQPRKNDATPNAEFLASHMQRRCDSVVLAQKTFAWLKSNLGAQICGRTFTAEEVDEAQLQCREGWAKLAGAVSTKDKSVDGSDNAEFIVRHIIRRCDNMESTAPYFEMLMDTAGKMNKLGRLFTSDQVTEAYMRCQDYFQAQDASSGASSGSDSDEGGPRKRRSKQNRRDSTRGSDDDRGPLLFSSEEEDLDSEEELDPEMEGSKELLVDLAVGDAALPPPPEDQYPGKWDGAPSPGFEGFNVFAAGVMKAAGIASRPLGSTLDTVSACPPLQAHQEAVAFLLHPKTPISRLLVDHPTGSGKTREMIRVLDNFFYDRRPKIPVFPTNPVCRNFYMELLRWPNRYRDYFACLQPEHAARASGVRDWRSRRGHIWKLSDLSEETLRSLCDSLKYVLEMRGAFYMGRMRLSVAHHFRSRFPDEPLPSAPLRALRYTSAGGNHTLLGSDGLPRSALFKIGFEPGNVYSNKVVVLDEIHNLVRTQTQYGEQLARLRDLLFNAKGMVLAGFTGTPILNEPSEGRTLLDVVKGRDAPSLDEGFLSSFPMRPPPLFPQSLPRGIPDAVLTPNLRRQFVQKVTLTGDSLRMYGVKQQRTDLPAQRLRAYCNMSAHFGSFHDGKNGTKTRILENIEECAPKFHAIAHAVASSNQKSLVLVSRNSGYGAMLAYMQQLAEKSTPRFNVATIDKLAEFNHVSNLRGERFRVLVADAAQCSEGVSFFTVRRVFLGDVPNSPSQLVQQCGRAIRMYGHHGLTEEEQTVTATLFVAGFPKWMRSTLALWCLRVQKKHSIAREMITRARKLLRTFRTVGITELEVLKKKLDDFGAKKAKNAGATADEKAPLEVEDVITFLETIGLWSQAKLVRDVEQAYERKHKENEGNKVARPRRVSTASVGFKASAQLAQRLSAKRMQAVKRKRMEERRQQQSAQSPANAKPPETKKSGKRRFGKPHHICRAFQSLYLASDMTAIIETLNTETADEIGLRELARKSADFAPALANLRAQAVDRSVLVHLAEEGPTGSDGESSTHEFCLSSGEDEEVDVPEEEPDAKKPKKAKVPVLPPLILPEGWTIQRTTGTNGRERRLFVDPRGRRYDKEAQVRLVIENAEKAKRMMTKWLADRRAKAEAETKNEPETPEKKQLEPVADCESMQAPEALDVSTTAAPDEGCSKSFERAEDCAVKRLRVE